MKHTVDRAHALHELYDIYDYHYIPFFETFLGKITIIIGCLIIISMIYYSYKKYKKKHIPFWEQALLAITHLEKKIEKTSEKNEIKSYYFSLTEIIKVYLHNRYGWQTLDKTDDELITYLKAQLFAQDLIILLQKMLAGAISVKFADENILKTQAIKDADIAREIIMKTKPLQHTTKQ